MSIRNLKKKFGKFYALDGVDVDLKPGMITCILGHNGAGKTTLINTILGLLSPTEGNIYYKGEDIHQNPDVLNMKVGYCSADICLYDDYTVSEFMMYICYLIGVPKPETHVKELLEKCNLQIYASQMIEKLSGGTKKRVSLACSLVGEPKILFLDEPSSGVDVANRKEIWSFLLSFISEERVILMTTHQLEEAENISTDIIVMHKGKVDVRGSPSDVSNKYGIASKFYLVDLKSENEKNEILEHLRSIAPRIKVDDSKFLEKARLEITLGIDDKKKLGKLIEILEEKNCKFYLSANSLEQAYINLGKSKSIEKPD